MKKATLLLTLTVALAANSLDSYAQASASATANATATIVTPIAITKTSDLEFGNVAVSATTGGTVIIAPDGSRSSTGGVTLPTTSPITISAAAFTVTGTADYTYVITLPSATVTLTDGELPIR